MGTLTCSFNAVLTHETYCMAGKRDCGYDEPLYAKHAQLLDDAKLGSSDGHPRVRQTVVY
jgi:hypothetical protein